MSFVRNCITKFLLGVSAVAWTACGEDSGTSAEDSKSTSFTRNTFLNADSLIAAAKAQKPQRIPALPHNSIAVCSSTKRVISGPRTQT